MITVMMPVTSVSNSVHQGSEQIDLNTLSQRALGNTFQNLKTGMTKTTTTTTTMRRMTTTTKGMLAVLMILLMKRLIAARRTSKVHLS